MTIVDHGSGSLTPAERERFDEIEASAQRSPGRSSTDPGWSVAGRVLLASLLAAAGAIHLAMVPSHASEWLPGGISFAVAGWLQIGLAVLLVAQPSRAAVRITCLANVVFIGAWVLTRIWGWPIGPEAGVPHAASFVDVVCVALEVVLVLAGYELLTRPDLGRRLARSTLVMLSIVPVGILVLATAAIVSPSASGHAHGETSGDGGAAHAHDGATETADHHADGAPTVDDKGLSMAMNGAGEGGGHLHDNTVVELDAGSQALLDDELAAMQPLMDNYPTVADAEAAGYRRQGPYAPALGAHYSKGFTGGSLNLGPTMSPEALKNPMLIYDGTDPDSKIAGFMYLIFSTDTENPPEGFVGPNDHWHYHTNVCVSRDANGVTNAPLGADQSATQELCDKYDGKLIANTGYMVHVWPVEGYESDQGLFSNLNSKLTCANGTYYTITQEEIGTRTSVCRDATE